MWRISGVLKISRNTIESIAVAVMTSPTCPKTHTCPKTRSTAMARRRPRRARAPAPPSSPHRADAFVGVEQADRAVRVVADPERRCDQADSHGEDHHHGVVPLVHAELARDRKQQRTKQH